MVADLGPQRALPLEPGITARAAPGVPVVDHAVTVVIKAIAPLGFRVAHARNGEVLQYRAQKVVAREEERLCLDVAP
jgi:hypothetical protein